MTATEWMPAGVLGIFLLTTSTAMAQGNGKGHGKGHDKHGDDDQGEHYYNHYDQEAFHGWYVQHEDDLPPGPCKERSLSAWIGKAASATRNASRRIAEVNSALPQRDRAYAASATA
jgi:hypothetical protein